jgi:hypothetical protein
VNIRSISLIHTSTLNIPLIQASGYFSLISVFSILKVDHFLQKKQLKNGPKVLQHSPKVSIQPFGGERSDRINGQIYVCTIEVTRILQSLNCETIARESQNRG